MYLTQDMEPTEQTATSEEIEIFDMFLLNRFETDEDLTATGEILPEIE